MDRSDLSLLALVKSPCAIILRNRTRRTSMDLQQSRRQDSQQTLNLVDLDAYFRRVRYVGAREPTLETLQTLQRLHIEAIPFEAIDVLLGRLISLEPSAVDDKLIGRRRGGYCYEQN